MESDVIPNDDRMSSGEITGLVVGLALLLALLILLIIWFVRFRHYWVRRKHSKMPSTHIVENQANGTPNQLYATDTMPQQRTTEGWSNLPFGTGQSYWQQPTVSSFGRPWYHMDNNIHTEVPPSKTYSYGFHPHAFVGWNDSVEPPVSASYVPNVQTEQIARAPSVYPATTEMGPYGAYHLGDLSMASTNAFNLYPRGQQGTTDANMPSMTQAVGETMASTTESSGTQNEKAEKSTRKRLRSKVRKVARVSQISVTRLPVKRFTNLSTFPGKRLRSKRGRLSSVGLPSDFNQYGEGYDNMNARTGDNNQNFDELGSLDNDSFLNSLELAVYPGLLIRQPTPGTTSRTDNTESTTYPGVRFQTTVSDTSRQDALDPLHMKSADLGLGMYSPASSYARRASPARPAPTFRFPAPGPPVAGWAHQFARNAPPQTASTDDTLSSPTNTTEDHTGRSPPSSQTSSQPNPMSDSVPLLPPPPVTPLGHTSRRKWSTESSLLSAAIPRQKPSKLGQSRQRSEPRKSSHGSDTASVVDTITQQSDYGLNSIIAGSLSTLESMVDTGSIQPQMSFALPVVDSGYQDSFAGTPSLDHSVQRVDPTVQPVIFTSTQSSKKEYILMAMNVHIADETAKTKTNGSDSGYVDSASGSHQDPCTVPRPTLLCLSAQSPGTGYPDSHT